MSAQLTGDAAPADWQLYETSTANAPATATQAAPSTAVTALRHRLTDLSVSWSGAAPGAGVAVEVLSGATPIWAHYIGDAGATQGVNTFSFVAPIEAAPGQALAVIVAAAGAGVTTKVTAQGVTRAS